MPDKTHDAPTDDLRALAATRDASRRRADVGTWVASRQHVYRQMAYGLCRRYGLRPAEQQDDVAQIVATTAFVLATDLADDPQALAEVRSFDALLRLRTADKVRAWAHSESGRAPMSGMQATLRRRTAVERTRESLRQELGREPSDTELIDAHNAAARRRLKNAAQQGMLVTADDLAPLPTAVSVDHDRAVAEPGEDCPLAFHEARSLALAVVEGAALSGCADEAAVGRAWMGGFAAGVDAEPLPSQEISEQTGIPVRRVRELLVGLREYAMNVAAARYGLERPDAA